MPLVRTRANATTCHRCRQRIAPGDYAWISRALFVCLPCIDAIGDEWLAEHPIGTSAGRGDTEGAARFPARSRSGRAG